MEKSKCLKAQLPPPFSIDRLERKAVQVAKALKPIMGERASLTTQNCEAFCVYMRDTCKVPYVTTKAMLQNLLPLRVDALGMFRLSLAIIGYLPEFKHEMTLADLQEDFPNVWAHVRILDVDVREETPGHFSAYLEVLFLTSQLAGRLLKFRVPYTQLRYVFKSIGLRNRIKESEVLIPRELCSMYAHIHLGDTDRAAFSILGWTATASEKKRNKNLMLLRKKKDCDRVGTQCVDCPLGKDRCALACRKRTIEDTQNNGTAESKDANPCG